jgi:HAD superfamily hydrolase (TIGR01484 family)
MLNKMGIYKAIITDLDGTVIELSSNGEDIKKSTIEAIKKAQSNGYKIACATGRRWSFTKPIIDKLGIVSPCIIQGGSSIVDPLTNKVIWEKHLDIGAIEAVFDIFKRESINGSLSTFHLRHKDLSEIDSAPKDARFMYLLGVS